MQTLVVVLIRTETKNLIALDINNGPQEAPKYIKISRNSPQPIDFTIHRLVRHSAIESISAEYLYQERVYQSPIMPACRLDNPF